MKKNNLTILITILFSLFLYSCGSVGEALQGKKRSKQSDEFLVEKKNPLEMPPDMNELPTPGNQEISETKSDNNEIKSLLKIQNENNQDNENSNNSSDIESSILKKIQ
jgi:hypothetical protein|tara:strand:+ start:1320 stop:1643 length:324 start_codon:yes stop_codon:yes gene_type:complete